MRGYMTIALTCLLLLSSSLLASDLGRAAAPLPGTTSRAQAPRPVGTLPTPVYPEAAAEEGWVGTCRVRLRISSEGEILEAVIAESSGREDADQAALDAATSVSWRPGTDHAGKALTQDITLTFTFELYDHDKSTDAP